MRWTQRSIVIEIVFVRDSSRLFFPHPLFLPVSLFPLSLSPSHISLHLILFCSFFRFRFAPISLYFYATAIVIDGDAGGVRHSILIGRGFGSANWTIIYSLFIENDNWSSGIFPKYVGAVFGENSSIANCSLIFPFCLTALRRIGSKDGERWKRWFFSDFLRSCCTFVLLWRQCAFYECAPIDVTRRNGFLSSSISSCLFLHLCCYRVLHSILSSLLSSLFFTSSFSYFARSYTKRATLLEFY